jgi:glycosyltransferase involved in cell wall biosynthesis
MNELNKSAGSSMPKKGGAQTNYDLVCLSHLRWDFVFQRPQHLLSRFARDRRVFFIEEPMFSDEPNHLDISPREDNLFVVVPRLSHETAQSQQVETTIKNLLDEMFREQKIENFVLWYYTPMAIPFSEHLTPLATVYDCMDELSAFKFAHPELLNYENNLFGKADLVFTGGQSLYEAKRDRHERVFAFPSSIDTKHFAQARVILNEPEDQKSIAHPRLGFCGVIDERMDAEMLGQMADLRPEWQFVMIGPVVKISDEDLPKRPNIHYLGGKDYKYLPKYIAGWDVAIMPFAINESTKFISPTKTPEYLAAGKPVVSTPIRDVVRPYGELGLVHIAATAEEFVSACEQAMSEHTEDRVKAADEFLSQMSWDKTWQQMADLIEEAAAKKQKAAGTN